MNTTWISLMMAMVSPGMLHAAVIEKNVSYADAEVKLEGVHVYDDSVTGPRPAVLVIHQWMGITDQEKKRARMK